MREYDQLCRALLIFVDWTAIDYLSLLLSRLFLRLNWTFGLWRFDSRRASDGGTFFSPTIKQAGAPCRRLAPVGPPPGRNFYWFLCRYCMLNVEFHCWVWLPYQSQNVFRVYFSWREIWRGCAKQELKCLLLQLAGLRLSIGLSG